MDATQSFFLSVLRFYFNRDVLPDAAGTDWAVFGRLCRNHNVEGIAYSALKAAGLEAPHPVKTELKTGFAATVAFENLQALALRELENELEAEKIAYISFKGLVIKELYPEPELRTMGDMDILVRERDLAGCGRIMSRLDYSFRREKNADSYQRGGVRFEMHSSLEYAMPVPGKPEDVWKRATAGPSPFRLSLDPQFQLVLMLDHMAKHAFRGFGVRMLLDVVVWSMRYPDGIDPAAFAAELGRRRILEFSKRIFALCRVMFAAASPFPNYALTDGAFETLGAYILTGGAFGRCNPQFAGIDYMLGKKYALHKSAVLSRLAVLLWLTFPPYRAVSQTDYPYLRGRPYLLPIAWIHRGFSRLFRSRAETLSAVGGIIGGRYGNSLETLLGEFGLQLTDFRWDKGLQ